MGSSSERINIAAHARKIDVDNRYSLRFYYRIADNILRKADIFRVEKNIIDQYVMLLRYSSLVSETIPCHRDYRASSQNIKDSLRKKLLNALTELERLKPVVLQQISELNAKHALQVNGQVKFDGQISSATTKTLTNYQVKKATRSSSQGFVYQDSRTQRPAFIRPVEDKFCQLSLGIPRAKEETLSRHSIFGPNGLYGKWQPPKTHSKVQYPSNIDLRPVEIPRLQQSPDSGPKIKEVFSNQEPQKSTSISESNQNNDSQILKVEDPPSLISFEATETSMNANIIRQLSPPPVLAEVQELVPAASPQITEENRGKDNALGNFVFSENPLQLHISTTMMDGFMKLAKSNTVKNLETCGILAGSLKDRKFFVTALIIPKQESTSDSCQTTNEEEIFEVQDKQELLPLGWIHTHPTQSCFMSSIDLHTHYSYQTMLPEAVAIVMAPRDSLRTHGIFRLTTPGGISVIRNCQQRGFHPHEQPPDGGPIYKSCTDVYMNPNLKFDVIDLR